MHNREGLSIKRLWVAVCDYDLWPLYILLVTLLLLFVNFILTIYHPEDLCSAFRTAHQRVI